MATLHADDRHLIDTITKTPIGPRDLVVIRSERDRYVSMEQQARIVEGFTKRGVEAVRVLVLPSGVELDTLPDEAARQLYERLKLRFAP